MRQQINISGNEADIFLSAVDYARQRSRHLRRELIEGAGEVLKIDIRCFPSVF
jgi:hypothetical protein